MIIGLFLKEGTTCSTVNQYTICDDRFINFSSASYNSY